MPGEIRRGSHEDFIKDIARAHSRKNQTPDLNELATQQILLELQKPLSENARQLLLSRLPVSPEDGYKNLVTKNIENYRLKKQSQQPGEMAAD